MRFSQSSGQSMDNLLLSELVQYMLEVSQKAGNVIPVRMRINPIFICLEILCWEDLLDVQNEGSLSVVEVDAMVDRCPDVCSDSCVQLSVCFQVVRSLWFEFVQTYL